MEELNAAKDSKKTSIHTWNSSPKKIESKGDIDMDDATKKLIDRLDQDVRDHKQETRDRDVRIQSEFQEREKRIHDDANAREQRLFDLINSVKADIDKSLGAMNNNINNVRENTENTYKHITGITIATISLAVAAVIGIAAMVVTILLTK